MHVYVCVIIDCFSKYIGDASASRAIEESEIDGRVKEALQMEDPKILRHMNQNQGEKYGVFWEQCRVFLDVCMAVHERRHDDVNYTAKGISV